MARRGKRKMSKKTKARKAACRRNFIKKHKGSGRVTKKLRARARAHC